MEESQPREIHRPPGFLPGRSQKLDILNNHQKKNKKKGQSKKESQVSGVEEQATIIKRYVLLSFDITFNDLYNII